MEQKRAYDHPTPFPPSCHPSFHLVYCRGHFGHESLFSFTTRTHTHIYTRTHLHITRDVFLDTGGTPRKSSPRLSAYLSLCLILLENSGTAIIVASIKLSYYHYYHHYHLLPFLLKLL